MNGRIRRTQANDIKQSIFGVSDGLTSALGVVIPLALAHRPMFNVAFGLAICTAVGMGGGEFLSDTTGNRRSAVFMAIASFAGTLIPALPFFVVSYAVAAIVSGVSCLATVLVIAETKARDIPRRFAYAQTFGILLVAGAITVAFTFATGASG